MLEGQSQSQWRGQCVGGGPEGQLLPTRVERARPAPTNDPAAASSG